MGVPHLWLVLTDPDPKTTLIITVMVVTERPHTDRTVVLEPGDHSFIRHRSSIDYGSARYVPISKMSGILRNSAANWQPDMTPKLLARVRQGLLASPRTINAIADDCRKAFGK